MGLWKGIGAKHYQEFFNYSLRELKWVRRAVLDLFIVNAKEEFVHFFRK